MRSVVVFLALISASQAAVYNIQRMGAMPGNDSLIVCDHNTFIFNNTLSKLQPGDTLLVPNSTFCMQGGVGNAAPLRDVTLQIDGTLSFANDIKAWPTTDGKHVRECIMLEGLSNVTITSSGTGTLQGNGEKWWGYISYLLRAENRPRLLHIHDAVDLLVENIHFLQSPYWTFLGDDVAGVEIRHCAIDVRRDNATNHDIYDLGAFNTDGFDLSGKDVYIHDVKVWNDDDCVCVKGIDGNGKNAQCSENWLVERVNVSGVGLTIGSIGPSDHHTCVKNITFRDSTMVNTFKGLYLKSRPGNPGQTGEITDVLYENITITNPTQWALWIGPQQAIYGGACSLAWPWLPLPCPVPSEITWTNLTFRNIDIINPKTSPGVVIGNTTNPMTNILFDGVKVSGGGTKPFGADGYKCEGVTHGVATGGTSPVPPCFASGR